MAAANRLVAHCVPLYGSLGVPQLISKWMNRHPTCRYVDLFKDSYWDQVDGEFLLTDANPDSFSMQCHVNRKSGVVLLQLDDLLVVETSLKFGHRGPMVAVFDGEAIGEFVETPANRWTAVIDDLPPSGTTGVLQIVWATTIGVARSEPFRARIQGEP